MLSPSAPLEPDRAQLEIFADAIFSSRAQWICLAARLPRERK